MITALWFRSVGETGLFILSFRQAPVEANDVKQFVNALKKETPSRAAQMFYQLLKSRYTSGVIDLSVDNAASQIGTFVGSVKDFPEAHLLMLQAVMSSAKPTSGSDGIYISRIAQAFPWIAEDTDKVV